MANKNATIDRAKVMTTVSSVVSFIKEQISSDLLEAKSKGHVKLDNDDHKKICFFVETSITNSFVKASGQIEESLK